VSQVIIENPIISPFDEPTHHRRSGVEQPLQHAESPVRQGQTGKIAVKVINHYGDEMLKVFDV
jgi:hypothetical protein